MSDGPQVLTAEWLSEGRAPTHPPNPRYPRGVVVDLAGEAIGCTIALRYPAECVGSWLIECPACGLRVLVTAAGRVDDPRSVRLACGSPKALDA